MLLMLGEIVRGSPVALVLIPKTHTTQTHYNSSGGRFATSAKSNGTLRKLVTLWRQRRRGWVARKTTGHWAGGGRVGA